MAKRKVRAAKKRVNRTDLTLRNLRSLKAAHQKLVARHRLLTELHHGLAERVRQLEERVEGLTQYLPGDEMAR